MRRTAQGRESGEAPSPDATGAESEHPDRQGEWHRGLPALLETTRATHDQPPRSAPQSSILRKPPLISPLLKDVRIE